MNTTLEEIIQQENEQKIKPKEAIKLLLEHFQKEENLAEAGVLTTLEKLVSTEEQKLESDKKTQELLQALLDKEQPEQKEVQFPDVQKVKIISPVSKVSVTNFPDFPEQQNWKPYFDNLLAKQNTTNGLLAYIASLLERDAEEDLKEKEPTGTTIVNTRKKSYFKIISLTGTIDGSNMRFYLSEAPKYGTQVFLMLDNTPQQPTQNFTLKGAQVDYTFPPQVGQKHWAMAFRS